MPLPTPARARLGSVQPTTEAPSSNVVTRRGRATGANASDFLIRYQEWQEWARRFARTNGAASFSASITADCCARCEVFVEERNEDGEWERSEDPRFNGVMELYANPLQGPDELIRLHAHHYQVAGEMVQVQRDAENGGVEYGIYSVAACKWDDPTPGLVTVRLVPDGKVDKGTAFVVPRAQAVRFWIPDAEWPAYAWSPMAATVDDLRRWQSMAGYAQRVSDSALAMNGILWAPEGPFAATSAPDLDEDEITAGVPRRGMEEDYYEAARLGIERGEDVSAIAPMLWHWDKEEGAPQWIKVGEGLDPEGIAHRREALEDFSRGTNVPSTVVMGGGVGDANHWSEWLASDKFFDSAVAPTMNRICFLDLTRSFLWPRALLAGRSEADLGNIRIGYDPSPVIVKPDVSDLALRAWAAGVLNIDATIEACNFDQADKLVDDAEKEWLLKILAHGREFSAPPTGPGSTSGEGRDTPVGPATVNTAPPTRPVAGGRAAAPRNEPRPFGPERGEVRRAVAEVTKLRQSLGTRLRAEAEQAYEHALHAAGVKLVSRARNRAGATRQAQVRSAVDNRDALAPLLAVVGLKEHELLLHAFDTFRSRASREILRYRDRVERVVRRAGLSDDVIPKWNPDDAVEYLVAGLTAMARHRLLVGDEAALAAAAPKMIPRVIRRSVDRGDLDLPGLPNPDELAAAASRLVRNAIGITENRGTLQLSTTPDLLPEYVTTDEPRIEESMIDEVTPPGEEPIVWWEWVHGYYGEPVGEFEPHVALDGLVTNERENDPALTNEEAWPDVDAFRPGDHDGCSCEWVVSDE